MKIIGIKAKKVMACPGSWAIIAEAEVEVDGESVYVLAQEYDTLELTVSKKSVYSFLVEEGDAPFVDFLEEYTEWEAMKGSAYAGVFEKLEEVMDMLG